MLTFGRSAYFCEPVFSMQPVYDFIISYTGCMGKSFKVQERTMDLM